MKPFVGITSDYSPAGRDGSLSKKEDTYFLRARYLRAIEDLGGIPFILPLTETPALQSKLLDKMDGLLVTGSGDDLDPRLYGERKRAAFPLMDPRRARFELSMIRAAVRRDLPVLGICGGLQAMNVALGGSLLQDIRKLVPDALVHKQKISAIHPSHSVQIEPATRLHAIVKRRNLRVNSSHHQAPAGIAPGLSVNAVSPDGVIEGLESTVSRFVIGIQWHPEFLYRKDEASQRLFRAFLRAAGRA
jgi:putative glutamine amidotransferase